MSPKPPVASGKQFVKFLASLGYEVQRQRGSHIRLKRKTSAGSHCVTVPAHGEIARGTLNDIVNSVSLNSQISKEELLERLREYV